MSSSNNSNSNQPVVPSAREALNKFKMEAAQEVGVNLKQGYNGDLTSREAGSVGGQMVKKMIQAYENSMRGGGIPSAPLLPVEKVSGIRKRFVAASPMHGVHIVLHHVPDFRKAAVFVKAIPRGALMELSLRVRPGPGILEGQAVL